MLILSSVALWLMFLVLGIMGIYMRQVAKINTVIFLKKMSFWTLIIASIILLLQLALTIFYVTNLVCTPKQKPKQPDKPEPLVNFKDGVIAPAIIIEATFMAL